VKPAGKMNTFGKQTFCPLDIIKPYQRPKAERPPTKASNNRRPKREPKGVQAVRSSALLGGNINMCKLLDQQHTRRKFCGSSQQNRDRMSDQDAQHPARIVPRRNAQNHGRKKMPNYGNNLRSAYSV
jgi:hypothetical protein